MEKKKGIGILIRMVGMCAIPMAVQAMVLLLYSLSALQKGIQEEALSGLEHLCQSISAAYDVVDPGDYHLEGELLYKGKYCITEHQDTVDSFTKGTEVVITIFYGSIRKATSLRDTDTGERIIGTGASYAVSNAVLQEGKDYCTTKIQINRENYYAYYIPLRNRNGEIAGMLFAGQPSAGVDATIRKKASGIFLIGVCILTVALGFSIFVVKKMADSIIHAENLITEISGGSLQVTFNERQKKISMRAKGRKDEIGRMISSVYGLMEKLYQVIGGIRVAADSIMQAGGMLESMAVQTGTATEEISRAVEEITKGAVLQAEEIEIATRQIADIGLMTDVIDDSVKGLKETSKIMAEADKKSVQIIYELGISSDKTMESIKKIDASIHRTGESVEQIQEAAGIITAIARETSLIALNASIEAAKAGETGKGFAVVASRISRLAEESAASAGTIGDVIKKLSRDSEASIQDMVEVRGNIKEQQGKLKKTRETYAEVSKGIEVSMEETEKIDKQAEECSKAKEKVMDVIENLSAISEENAAATEETAASMQELDVSVHLISDTAEKLKRQSEDLEKGVSYFRI